MFTDVLTQFAQEIVENTEAIIGHNVTITDKNGIIIGVTNKKRIGTLHASSFYVIQNDTAEGLYEEEAKAIGVLEGVCLPIHLGKETIGTVSVAGRPDEVDKYGHLVQKEVELFLREKSLTEISKLKENALCNLVNQILTFKPDDVNTDIIVSYAKSLGYNFENAKIIILIDINHFSDIVNNIHRSERYSHEAELRVQTIKLTILSVLRGIFINPQDIVINIASDKYVALLDLSGRLNKDIKAYVEERTETVFNEMSRLGYSAIVGIGSVSPNIAGLADSYRSACKAISIGNKVKRKSGIYNIENYEIEDLFLSLNRDTVKKYINHVLGSLINSPIWDKETEKTLREVLKNPCRPGYISKNLGIHRNSLYYRIEKIEEFSGINLKDQNDFTKIKIALILYDLFSAMKD